MSELSFLCKKLEAIAAKHEEYQNNISNQIIYVEKLFKRLNFPEYIGVVMGDLTLDWDINKQRVMAATSPNSGIKPLIEMPFLIRETFYLTDALDLLVKKAIKYYEEK